MNVVEIINSLESGKAVRFLQEKGEQVDDETHATLLAVAFPDLPDADASRILREHILDFYRYNVPFENRLQTRYINQGSTNKNEQRKLLKQSVLENTERIGNLTIAQWITAFITQHPEDTRTNQDILNFILKHPNIEKLGEQSRSVIKNILYVYTTLLASDILDIFDLVNIKNSLSNKKPSVQNVSPPLVVDPQNPHPTTTPTSLPTNISSAQKEISERPISPTRDIASDKIKTVQLPLTKAMQKYPKLTHKHISSNKIIIKGNAQPVPPTIKNWLTVYHQEMGAGQHEPFERSQFLFHNKNAVMLSQKERNTVSEVLKSADENTPLSIEPISQRLVFSNIENSESSNQEAPIQETAAQTITFQQEPTNQAISYEAAPAQEQTTPAYTQEPAQATIQAPTYPQAETLNTPQMENTIAPETSYAQDVQNNITPSAPQSERPVYAPEPTTPQHNIQTQPQQPQNPPATPTPNYSQNRQPQPTMPTPERIQQPVIPSHQVPTNTPNTRKNYSSLTPTPQGNTSFQQQLLQAKEKAGDKQQDYTDYYPIAKQPSNTPEQAAPKAQPIQRHSKTTKERSFIIGPPRE